MAKAPAFQWYPKDCDTDENVRAMDDREFGFYMRCLNHSWLNNGLPSDLGELARVMSRSRSYVEKIWQRVGKCFELVDGRLVNKTQEKQRSTVREFVESRRSAANARWGASKMECIDDARALRTDCSAKAVADGEQVLPKETTCEKLENPPQEQPHLAEVVEFPFGRSVVDHHPETTRAVVTLFEDTDDAFVQALILKCVQEVISAGKPAELVSDELIAYAVKYCLKRNQQGAGLFLTTVPNWIRNQAITEDAHA